MDARQHRGLLLAAFARIRQKGNVWLVPSRSGNGDRYTVSLHPEHPRSITRRAWVKAHAMIGTLTNVVTSVEVTTNNSADAPFLPQLMNETVKRFTITDLCADKAYLSENNLQAIADIGAGAMMPFKANSVPSRAGVWNNAYHFFNLHREEFLMRYHLRSNIESTFSMIKRKFGDSVKAKTDPAMINETLAKVVAHNLCCLIHAIEEFGIDPSFSMPALGGAQQ